jgi:hypothetical protein
MSGAEVPAFSVLFTGADAVWGPGDYVFGTP